MELDELKTQWAEYDRKLDRMARIGGGLVAEARARKAGSGLSWAYHGIVFEQLMSIPTVVLLGVFISQHFSEPRYLVPAIVLDVFAVLSIVSCALQLSELNGVDYSEPVVAIQKKVERVRVLRLRTVRWGFLLWPVLWVPFMIVALRGVLGIDGYALFHGGWLTIDLAAGAAITVLLFLLSKALAGPFQRSRIGGRILDALAGRNLSRARTFLAELQQLEAEG